MSPTHTRPPLVSIGLPLYQGGDDAARVLDVLLNQTHHDLELLISDNASTDGSGERAADIAKTDPRVSYKRLDRTVSAGANFAAVLARASGEYFMWAAHDDDWEADHVARLVALLQSDESAVIACAIPMAVDAAGHDVVRHEAVGDLAVPDRVVRLARFIEQSESAGKANVIYGLFRRDVLVDADALAWFELDGLTDYHSILAVLARGHLLVDRGLTFRKRLHPSDLAPARGGNPLRSSAAFLADLRRTLHWIDGYERVLAAAGLPAEELVQLRRVVRARRRREKRQALSRFASLAGATLGRGRG
jgi:glycosyltransferase involved in cell wall biosynthesis